MTTSTLTLADFLLARIAEDEREANVCLTQYAQGGATSKRRWVRQLAECEAKRRIVEECAGQIEDEVTSAATLGRRVLRALAQPHASHPEFRAEWADDLR